MGTTAERLFTQSYKGLFLFGWQPAANFGEPIFAVLHFLWTGMIGYERIAHKMPNEKLKERNVEHVLQAAYELFLVHGIENTTKAMLVQASRISRSSIDRYFPSKVNWVLETAKWVDAKVRDEYLNQDARLVEAQQTGLDALRSYMEVLRDLMCEKPALFVLGAECRAFLYRNCINDADTARALHHTLGSSDALREIFARGIQDGSLKRGLNATHEATLTRESLLGFLTSIAITRSPSLGEKRSLVDLYIGRILQLYARSGETG